jgi:hypothetical protein
MITLKECETFARLVSNEMVLGATPAAAHRALLSSYLLNLWRGPKTVRKMIVADIRMWLDFGMPEHAADLLIVLRQFLLDYPESRFEQQPCEPPIRNFYSPVPRHAKDIERANLESRLASALKVRRSHSRRPKFATAADKRP